MSARTTPTPQLLAVLSEIREARFPAGVVCVRCGSPRVRRWGTFSGRQRYRCAGCRRTFSDLTGTPAAYLKRVVLLPAYRECMDRSLSVRAAARAIGVHSTTAFRWRHRLLKRMHATGGVLLSGLVECDESWVLCSDTVRQTTFRHRPRRSLADSRERRSWLLALRDRDGRSIVGFVGDHRPDRGMLTGIFAALIDQPATVITRQGRLSAHADSARRCDMPVWHRGAWRRLRADAPLAHVHNARQLLHRCRRWLRRFRGVKTKYLDNYLIWQGLIDAERRSEWRLQQLLRWPHRPNSPPHFPRTDAESRTTSTDAATPGRPPPAAASHRADLLPARTRADSPSG